MLSSHPRGRTWGPGTLLPHPMARHHGFSSDVRPFICSTVTAAVTHKGPQAGPALGITEAAG